MTEPAEVRWGRGLCGLLLSAWLGAVIHYSLLVTPALFAQFPGNAGELVGALFPGFFRFGSILTVLATLAALWAWSAAGWLRTRTDSWRLAWAVVALLAVAADLLVVYPMVQQAPAGSFGRLHGLSMLLIAVSGLTALAGAWVSLSSRRAAV